MADDYLDFIKDPFGGKGQLMTEHSGQRTWVGPHPQTGKLCQCRVEWVDPILEENKIRRAESAGKRWGDGQIVASIPSSMYYFGDFAKAVENDDQKYMTKFLNDYDNSKLRTKEGDI